MLQINKYLKHLAYEGKAINTIETYRYHLLAFDRWLYSYVKSVFELTRSDIFDFKEDLLRQKKSNRTVNGILSCVRNYYDFLIMHDELQINPVPRSLKVTVLPYNQRRLSDDELSSLVGYIEYLPFHTKAAFHLMLATGARVSEVAQLTKSDFLYKNNSLYIQINNAKYGSNRTIPLMLQDSALIVSHYIEQLEVSSEPAFRCSARTLQRHATNFSQKTGIDFSCHVLRHTFATRLLEKGIPIEQIQHLLGHRSTSMTRHYTQNAFSNFDEIAPKLPNLKENTNEIII